jgi:hypothetical protein
MRPGPSTTTHGLALTVNKAYVVRTLQELVRAGDGYTVKGLVAWAMLNGWQPAEIALLQDTAQGVLDGRSFQSGDKSGATKGAATGG